MKASKFVLDVIKNGYRLPFKMPCPPFWAKNNPSSLQHRELVKEAIQKFLNQICIRQVEQALYCCHPLTVVVKKKLRLVLDLRHINEYVQNVKFRYENLKTLIKIFKKRI